jgi:hypothetical protein
VAYWVKITYERNKYVIDLDRIAAFCCAPNGRVTFSLPDAGTTITLSKQGDVEDYQKVIDYIEKTTGNSL